MANFKRLWCLWTDHEWWGVIPLHNSEDNWTWLLCCKRCGEWDEMGATDRMMEWLKEQCEDG